ncbi:MAG: sigma-70 family RNA polymerase sigma factor [Candidatus Limnocylindrales bacterium]
MTGATPDALEPADPLEAALVERARGGDADAYGELVTMHQAAAFRVAWLLTGSAADAEDAAQDAFVKAYLALDRFHAGAAFRPWLLAVVGNEARNRRRASGRRDGLASRAMAAVRGSQARSSAGGSVPSAGAMPEAAVVASPELAVLAGETRREVHAALAALGDEERRVVTCRYLLGLSEAETAAVLGIPAGTAKSRLHRGLRRMRDVLEAIAPAEAGR